MTSKLKSLVMRAGNAGTCLWSRPQESPGRRDTFFVPEFQCQSRQQSKTVCQQNKTNSFALGACFGIAVNPFRWLTFHWIFKGGVKKGTDTPPA